MRSTSKRRLAVRGGLLAGLALGSCVAWVLNIFEIAHPQSTMTDSATVSAYPSMVLTVFVVLVTSGAFGAGLGLVASALIRDEEVQPGDAVDAARPQTTRPPARTIFGFDRGN